MGTQWNSRLITVISHLFRWVSGLHKVIGGQWPVKGLGRRPRKVSLIKFSGVRDNFLLGDWVPEEPRLVTGRIANKYTLLCVGVKLLALVFLDMHIGGAAKDTQMGHIRLGAMPELIWCCTGRIGGGGGPVVHMDKGADSIPPE